MQEIYSPPKRAHRFSGPPNLQSNGYSRVRSPEVMKSGREADHSCPPSAEAKSACSHTYTPQMASWRDAYLSTRTTSRVITGGYSFHSPIPAAARSKAWVCGRSLAGIVGSNPPGAWMSVSCECSVLSGRGFCVGLITRPEESYLAWCV